MQCFSRRLGLSRAFAAMPKLFVIPARDKPIAVIFRRGRHRAKQWYHVIQWNTRRDTFLAGAWIKGRIYEDKCDISPDGSLLLCFVLQGSRAGTDFTHAWTAVSRMPWLHALVLWPQGTTYGGGGRFLDNRTITVNGPTHKEFPLRGLRVVTADAPLHVKSDDVQDADWCGRDHDGRIVFSRSGQLFRREKSTDKIVADFTDMTPNPQPAPEWATRPLVSASNVPLNRTKTIRRT
jgi:hypothetical protein